MMVSIFRVLVRCLRLCLHFVVGVFNVLSLQRQHGKKWHSTKLGRKAIRKWMSETCDIVGLKLNVAEMPLPRSGQLYIANHVSWLDIVAIGAVTDCKFLSKDSIRHWPIIGWLGVSIGSLFIRRNSRREFHKSLLRVQERLEFGDSICIFPEGTTSDGLHVFPFHSGLLQAAIDAEVAVQPMVLKYQTKAGVYEKHAAYYGRDIFLFHLIRLLSKHETQLTLSFMSAIPLQAGINRQKLAASLQQSYAYEMQTLVENTDGLVLTSS